MVRALELESAGVVDGLLHGRLGNASSCVGRPSRRKSFVEISKVDRSFRLAVP